MFFCFFFNVWFGILISTFKLFVVFILPDDYVANNMDYSDWKWQDISRVLEISPLVYNPLFFLQGFGQKHQGFPDGLCNLWNVCVYLCQREISSNC